MEIASLCGRRRASVATRPEFLAGCINTLVNSRRSSDECEFLPVALATLAGALLSGSDRATSDGPTVMLVDRSSQDKEPSRADDAQVS